ncbi:MAG TPA: hypothetical protein VNW92_32025 [Polyangiaceae bacterium]|nr:hypothetical protein [Polyangiaceae bacterium]
MNPPRFWTVLALAQPGLFALLWSITSPRVRLAIWCHGGLARLAYRNFIVLSLLCVVFIAAIALTFVGHALGNTRLGWGMRVWWATALLLFSPITAPAYWAFHLRRS